MKRRASSGLQIYYIVSQTRRAAKSVWLCEWERECACVCVCLYLWCEGGGSEPNFVYTLEVLWVFLRSERQEDPVFRVDKYLPNKQNPQN